jgi:ABC-type bacteriocin/lantibiotic exporter with double-glycine peptidase domain
MKWTFSGGEMAEYEELEIRPAKLPWKRLAGLLKTVRGGLIVMLTLSIFGVLIGLVAPLALGTLIDALVERNDPAEAGILAGVIALSIVAETASYIVSDGFYSKNASRLFRNLRLEMFDGIRRGHALGKDDRAGLPSRFISDAETVGVSISVLDSGSMHVVELVSALIALGLLAPWTIVVVVPYLCLTWLVTRRMQEPAASAGQSRQEELEHMTKTITHELDRLNDPEAPQRFKEAVQRLFRVEVHFGWLEAINLQGSGGLAMLGPIAAVVVAAFTGTDKAGVLIALYLLAQRAFGGFDGLVDLSLGLNSVRGAVARCFALIDTPGNAAENVSSASVNV